MFVSFENVHTRNTMDGEIPHYERSLLIKRFHDIKYCHSSLSGNFLGGRCLVFRQSMFEQDFKIYTEYSVSHETYETCDIVLS